MIRKVLGGILIYSFLVYIIIEYGPVYDFQALVIEPANSLRSTPLFLLIGGIFWLIYGVIRHILKVVTLPFNWISFGLVHVILNVLMIYVFAYAVNAADVGMTMSVGSFIEALILAFILGIAGLFIKRL